MASASVINVQELPMVLTVQQIQKILGISRVKAYELVNRADFPAIRIGRLVRIPREAFLGWLNERRVKPQ